MQKIAIIGMGTGGMAILAAYEKEVDTSTLEIDCYDSGDSMGRGFPYREDSEELLLNLKTRKFGYDYENVDDFGEWHVENNLEEVDYASRPIFGKYTKDRLLKTVENTKANLINKEVIRIDKLNDKWEMEDKSGQVKVYDRIHLSNGVLSQKKLYGLEKSNKYINYPYPVIKKLDFIKKEDKVLIIGAGLTAVDIANFLLKVKNTEKITIFSRTNIIPTVRVEPIKIKVEHFTKDALNEILEKNYGRITFEQFDELFLKELEHQEINYEEYLETHMQGGIEGLIYNIDNPHACGVVQALLPPMNLVFNKVWDSMTCSDRKKFKEKYHPFMCLNRSPLPLNSVEIIIEAFKEGKLTMKEYACGVKINENGKFILIDKNGEKLRDGIEYDYTINGTGFDLSMGEIEEVNPLLKQLLDKRYIMIDDNGAITVVPETMQVISPRFGTLDKFHAYGVLASGVQYRNNSSMIIQMTAHNLIKELYK